MDNTPLQEKAITIMELADKGTQIKLKADDGKTYSFFKTFPDGNITPAFTAYKEMALAAQSTVAITYKDKPGKTKDGRPTTYHNIFYFNPAGTAKPQVHAEEAQAHPGTLSDIGVGNTLIDDPYEEDDQEKWERKDRLHAAQTAANFVSSIYERQASSFMSLRPVLEEVYTWLLAKKHGDEMPLIGTKIEDYDVPFDDEFTS